MKVLYKGHRYWLKNLDSNAPRNQEQLLQFVQRPPHHYARPGTTNQEVCRALIDRVKLLDQEVPWPQNAVILGMLRHIIFLHEIRAVQRHSGLSFMMARIVVKDHMAGRMPEDIEVGEDGHWRITL